MKAYSKLYTILFEENVPAIFVILDSMRRSRYTPLWVSQGSINNQTIFSTLQQKKINSPSQGSINNQKIISTLPQNPSMKEKNQNNKLSIDNRVYLKKNFKDSSNITSTLLSQIPKTIKINQNKFDLLENNYKKLHENNKLLLINSLKDKYLDCFKYNINIKTAKIEYLNRLFTLWLWLNIAKRRITGVNEVPPELTMEFLNDKCKLMS